MISMLLIALTVTIGVIVALCFILAAFSCIAVSKFILGAICLFFAILSVLLTFYISTEVID